MGKKKFVIHQGFEIGCEGGLPPSPKNLDLIKENVPYGILLKIADSCFDWPAGVVERTKFIFGAFLVSHILANLSGKKYDEYVIVPKETFIIDLKSIQINDVQQLSERLERKIILLSFSGSASDEFYPRFETQFTIVKNNNFKKVLTENPAYLVPNNPKYFGILRLFLSLEPIGKSKGRIIYSLKLCPINGKFPIDLKQLIKA